MKTLSAFKKENNIETIQFLKAKSGRMFAKIGALSIIVASNFVATKPAFVTYNEELACHVVVNSTTELGIIL